jgi:hypothetical protein
MVIPALGRLRQEDGKLEAILDCTARSFLKNKRELGLDRSKQAPYFIIVEKATGFEVEVFSSLTGNNVY